MTGISIVIGSGDAKPPAGMVTDVAPPVGGVFAEHDAAHAVYGVRNGKSDPNVYEVLAVNVSLRTLFAVGMLMCLTVTPLALASGYCVEPILPANLKFAE